MPAGSAATVTIEFREHLLLDGSKFAGKARQREIVCHEKEWHCVPEKEAPTDDYKLASSIELAIPAESKSSARELWTLRWSQPVHYDHVGTGADAQHLRRQLAPEPIQNPPTMMIPTTLSGSGPHYGECGFVRYYNTSDHVAWHGNKKSWYRFISLGDVDSTHATEAAARGAADISASPPTTYRQQSSTGQWQVLQVKHYWGPFPSKARAKNMKYHPGQDLAALSGKTPVFAMAGGRIISFKDADSVYAGRFLVIESSQDGQAFTHEYDHLDSFEDGIKKGTIIKVGQRIATAGRTGNIDKQGTSPSKYPTHVHLAVKRRVVNQDERCHMKFFSAPNLSGYFRHKPASWKGPRAALERIAISRKNLDCIPDDKLTPNLLPCGGEPSNTGLAGNATKCPILAKKDELTEAETNALSAEHKGIIQSCWARGCNMCPWETTDHTQLSRLYRWEFNGKELALMGANILQTDHTSAGYAREEDWSPVMTWKAYSGAPERGPITDTTPNSTSYSKRFDYTHDAQHRRCGCAGQAGPGHV